MVQGADINGNPFGTFPVDLLVDVFSINTDRQLNTRFLFVKLSGIRQRDSGIPCGIPETRTTGLCQRGDLCIRDIEECDARAQGADVFYRRGERQKPDFPLDFRSIR